MKRPSHWDEDPDYPVEDWKREVENDETRQGYHEWVRHQKLMRDLEPDEEEKDA